MTTNVIGITRKQSARIDNLKDLQREMKEKGTPMHQDIAHANMVLILGDNDF